MRYKRFVGYLICIFGFGITFWSFYPGAMSTDSVGNLTNGRTGVFYDINSPLLSYFWGALDTIVPGPGLMFVLQILIFWVACALLWHLTYRRSFLLGVGLTTFGLLPHILSAITVVWKDIGMGVAVFLAIVLVYFANEKKSIAALILSIVFLFIGCASRLNSMVAILPIAVWSGFVLYSVLERQPSKLTPALVGAAYFVAISAGAYVITYSLTDGRTTYPFQQNYLYDLAAISTARSEVIFPDYVLQHDMFVPELVPERYNARSVNDLLYPDCPLPGDRPILPITGDANEVRSLREKWIDTVRENPGAYLTHRIKVFAILVGLSRSVSATQLYLGFADNPPEYRGSENLGYRVLMKYFGAFRRPFPQTFFFRAFIWLILCAFFLYKALKNRLADDWALVAVLATSALLYTLAYFPTTPSTEFRYLFWPAIASMIALIFGVYLWRNEKFERLKVAEG